MFAERQAGFVLPGHLPLRGRLEGPAPSGWGPDAVAAESGRKRRESKSGKPMSKKSEQKARLQKQRIATPLTGLEEASGTAIPDMTPARSSGRGLGDLLKQRPKWQVISLWGVAVLAVLSCLCGILSLIVPPALPVPSPLMMTIAPVLGVVNSSPLPMYGVDTTCDLADVVDQSGFSSAPTENAPNPNKRVPVVHAKETIPVNCVGRMDLSGMRLRNVEFRVVISYFPFGWPLRRHTEYHVSNEVDPRGNFMHWSVQ
jgi:hypothetical protein